MCNTQVFRYNLNLQYKFSGLELEAALAGDTGDGGLLADLHMVGTVFPPCLVHQGQHEGLILYQQADPACNGAFSVLRAPA